MYQDSQPARVPLLDAGHADAALEGPAGMHLDTPASGGGTARGAGCIEQGGMDGAATLVAGASQKSDVGWSAEIPAKQKIAGILKVGARVVRGTAAPGRPASAPRQASAACTIH